MDAIITKILIIVGLLLTTLSAALLPLFCLKLTTRFKRKSRHQKCPKCPKVCDCDEASIDVSTKKKTTHENGNLKSLNLGIQRSRSRKKMLMSVLNCFAGGIFLGTSFIGLLPEIRNGFKEAKITWPELTHRSDTGNETSHHNEEDLMPVAEMFVVFGLFFILCVEQAAHSFNHWRQKRKYVRSKKNKMFLRMSSNKELIVEEGSPTSPIPPSLGSVSDVSVAKPKHDHSGIRSLMLVATLSIHSLLEGMAIGLQKESSSVVVIFIGVLFHKSLMAFSMGSSLVHSKQAIKKIFAAAVIFSFASPIGIAIGIVIDTSGANNEGAELINAILQAIATGTFLYITFFEVLVQEFESHGNRLAKVVGLFLGYGSILTTFFFAHH